jgi:hypothetical protein
MLSEWELKQIREAIIDINDALSGVDRIKDGIGLYGECTVEVNLVAAKERLRRIIISNIGEA